MSVKHKLGVIANRAFCNVLSSSWYPLFGTLHLRQNWLYDVCRFAGTRDIKIAFDVGANEGAVAREMGRFFPRAQIHAFEPVKKTFMQLRESVRGYKNITPHAVALGEVEEQVVLEIQKYSAFNSLKFRSGENDKGNSADREEVSVTTVDRFCESHGIEFIDILKTDAQGFDVEVLCGADSLMKQESVAFVYAEAGFQAGDDVNTPFPRIHACLTQYGFELAGFYEQWGVGPNLTFCNTLYANPRAIRRRFGN